MPWGPVRVVVALVAAGLWTSVAAQQRPVPDEWSAYTLTNVGPVPVTAACSCIANPFMIAKLDPGGSDAVGPAGPSAFAPPSREQSALARARDEEDRAALPVMIENALAGSAADASAIAMLYMSGTAVPRSDIETARWFHLAARLGDPFAALQLGHRYHRGLGVTQSDQTAAYWFYSSAKAGDRLAMVALGLLYAAGRGVQQDWGMATSWWKSAIDAQKTPLASRLLGDAYACGLGVERDPQLAAAEYRTALAAGEVGASVQLGRLYAGRCIAGGDTAALKAFEDAAQQGNIEAQIEASQMHREGRGADANDVRAYLWARLAQRRAPPGELQAQASAATDAAARLLPAFLIADTDAMVEQLIELARMRSR